MKIIILTSNNSYQKYFVNQIADKYDIEAVIINGEGQRLDRLKRLRNRYKSNYLLCIIFHFYKKIKFGLIKKLIYVKKNDKTLVLNQLFGNYWREFHPWIKCLYNKKKRFIDYLEIIKTIAPDVIIVHGGGWVPKELISFASKYTINLHWGTSPYYRGTYCTAHCIYNDDIENIGVTIHSLNQVIDGGDIFVIKKPKLQANDDIFSIEMKLTLAGTNAIIDLLSKIEIGDSLVTYQQDYSLGKLFLEKDMNLRIALVVKDKILSKNFDEIIVGKNEWN